MQENKGQGKAEQGKGEPAPRQPATGQGATRKQYTVTAAISGTDVQRLERYHVPRPPHSNDSFWNGGSHGKRFLRISYQHFVTQATKKGSYLSLCRGKIIHMWVIIFCSSCKYERSLHFLFSSYLYQRELVQKEKFQNVSISTV